MTAVRVFQTGLFQGATDLTASDTKLASIMDGLDTILAGLVERHHAYPVESITPPCTVVGFPTEIDFDAVFGRGADRFVVPVWFVVGKTMTVDARDRMSEVLSESGTIKSELDGNHTFGDFPASVRVTNAAVADIQISAVTYLSCRFDCEVYA